MKRKVLALVMVLCTVVVGLVLPGGEAAYAAAVTPMVAGGAHYSLALKSDGTLWAWGSNDEGHLGDGTTVDRHTPVQVVGLSEVLQISAGSNHALALKNDGTVWAWGHNVNGQLGDGTITQRNTPVQVTGLSGIVSISGAGNHSFALKNDGTIWAWGANANGQLGDGTTTQRNTPIQISSLSNITKIVAGSGHNLALRNDGIVWAWGINSYGQLGDGTTAQRNTPIQVSGLSNIIDIDPGDSHSIALKNDGTVWTWGLNNYGALGDGTTTNRYTPVQVSGLSDVISVEGGSLFSIVLKNDGTVWAWGYNSYGKLGDGTTTERHQPVQVSGLSEVTSIASGFMHSLAIKNDGSIWAWGYNSSGGLGDGTTTDRYTPVQVAGFNLYVPPVPPANLTATVGDTQVSLMWDAVSGVTGYNIKRADIPGGPYTTIANNFTETSYTDTDLTNGTTYYYVVSAINAGGESANSNEASATPQVGIPAAPLNLMATPGNTQINLSWDAVSGSSGYNVKRATISGGPYDTIASSITETTLADTGLTNGTTYFYVVSAVNGAGESANSNEASATPQQAGGNRAILELTMTNGAVKEYDLTWAELNAFLTWYDGKAQDIGKSYFALSKNFIAGPFLSRNEYVSFDKIDSFEVMEYTR